MWRGVPGFEELYRISEFGDVYSIRGNLNLKPDLAKGYRRVSLSRGNKKHRFTVHRLVALAFLGEAPNDEQTWVLHADDDPMNNHYSNLRWGTPKENVCDAVRNRKHRNSRKVKCPQGHKYTPENTYIKANGWRICRQCSLFYSQRGRERRRVSNGESAI